MTQQPLRSPDSPPCLIRPAQTDDRKTIERLVCQFHRSLQFGQVPWIRPLPHQALGTITFVSVALLLVLAVYGFYLHVFVLAIMLALILQARQPPDKTLAHFWVIECNGRVIGCAKLFCYGTYSEAYLVFVDPAWRGKGYGSRLVQQLTRQAALPLYLASQPHRMQFYMRLGFVPLPPDAFPNVVRNRLGIDRYQEYGIVGMVFGQSATRDER